MIAEKLLADLKLILAEEQVNEEEASAHPLGNSGQVEVYPKSEEEISSILKYANENGKKISVIGGGTKRGFGGLVESADILLSLSNYKGIVEHTAGDMTVTVKAGTLFEELQEYLAKHNQQVSLDPPWHTYATIGGVIAANESGPKRLGYGSARDVVIGMKLVYPDGTVIRSGGKVVKNVAGYDMNKLFIGSMGTLAVISEITLKLCPLAKFESLALVAFPKEDLQEIRTFVTTLLDSMMEPVALELLNSSLSQKLTNQPSYTLAISFEDVESAVRYQENFIKSIKPLNAEITVLQQQAARMFWNEFYQLGANGAVPSINKETEATLKIGVTNFDVLNVIKESEEFRQSHQVEIDAHGGLGHGLCQIYIKGASESIISVISKMRHSVASLGGYVVVKHLPFVLRQKVSVWGEPPAHFCLLEGIKSKVDPNRVLNDKRFVGGI
ncbi:FAD-binding oxidoreductase [Priestia megaterium]|nr:FAD-binding oxidoreductase [Priestia megaterium]